MWLRKIEEKISHLISQRIKKINYLLETSLRKNKTTQIRHNIIIVKINNNFFATLSIDRNCIHGEIYQEGSPPFLCLPICSSFETLNFGVLKSLRTLFSNTYIMYLIYNLRRALCSGVLRFFLWRGINCILFCW